METSSGSADLLPGTLFLLILRTLSGGPLHGYAIAVKIEGISEDILRVEEGSLYPALHRMEEAGCRPRKHVLERRSSGTILSFHDT